jgi:hypothetical protein
VIDRERRVGGMEVLLGPTLADHPTGILTPKIGSIFALLPLPALADHALDRVGCGRAALVVADFSVDIAARRLRANRCLVVRL